MKRDENATVFSFLCWGCLRSTKVAVPTTPNIYTDMERAENRLAAQGWVTVKEHPEIRHYCEWCKYKGRIPRKKEDES